MMYPFRQGRVFPGNLPRCMFNPSQRRGNGLKESSPLLGLNEKGRFFNEDVGHDKGVSPWRQHAVPLGLNRRDSTANRRSSFTGCRFVATAALPKNL